MSEQSALALRCPGCGAPVTAGAARCGYCQSKLATVSCPSCFALLFDAAAFCPSCGAARNRSEHPEFAGIRCPACKGAMRWVRLGATDLLECEDCDGTWIEAETFTRLCADRESQAALLPAGSPAPGPPAKPAGPVRYRPCPRCTKLMNRVNFGRLSGTVVDVCRGHGTFLDRGELHEIVRFLMGGGADRARQAEREELAEQERQLRTRERDQGGFTPVSSAVVWDEPRLKDFLAALLNRS